MNPNLGNPPGVPAPFADRFSNVARIPSGSALLVLSGQAAVDADGAVIAPGDVKAQTTIILEQVRGLLAAHGATLENVVHLRTFMLDLGRLGEYGAARTAFFTGLTPPASTTVGVSALFRPGVELEVEVLASV